MVAATTGGDVLIALGLTGCAGEVFNTDCQGLSYCCLTTWFQEAVRAVREGGSSFGSGDD